MPQQLSPYQRWHLDKPLLTGVLILSGVSLLILYSADAQGLRIILAQAARLAVGLLIMVAIAQLRPETLARWTPYIYLTGLALLAVVLIVGAITKGAQRWLDLYIIRFQPSELMKLGVPLMVAWYFSDRNLPPGLRHTLVAAGIILLPVLLVAIQPDLGTALMIMAAGAAAIFLAGMRWYMILGVLATVAAAAPLVWTYFMHDYQRRRVLTLFDPESDPLGTGYHTIQSMIAVGSGGFFGKGWNNSSQAFLEFLPESSTDFVFAVYAEEFGLLGTLVLVSVYLFLFGRGMLIATYAQDTYSRLLAGSLSLTFFLYFFVNIGMVTGILPVVGVPLPVISYGGSSIVTILAGFGILMSIHTHRRIVQF